MGVKYRKRMGKKAQKAVIDFVQEFSNRQLQGDPHFVTYGPEGGVFVLVETDKPGVSRRMKLSREMSKISARVLEKHGVWVVGIPTRSKQEKLRKYRRR